MPRATGNSDDTYHGIKTSIHHAHPPISVVASREEDSMTTRDAGSFSQTCVPCCAVLSLCRLPRAGRRPVIQCASCSKLAMLSFIRSGTTSVGF